MARPLGHGGLCLLICGSLLTATAASAQSRAFVLTDTQAATSVPASVRAQVVVIDVATGSQIASIELGQASQSTVRDLVFKADGSVGYVTDEADVAVIDPVTNTISGRFSAGASPSHLALSADGTRLFVANAVGNSISVVNTATRTVTATIALPFRAWEMALAPDGTRLYALAGLELASVYVVDLGTMAVTATITTEARPHHLTVHPDGSRLYLTHSVQPGMTITAAPAFLTAVDTATFAPAGRVDFPNLNTSVFTPSAINETDRPVMLPDGSRLLVPHWFKSWRTSPTAFMDSERVQVIDPATMTLWETILPPKPAGGGEGRMVAAIPAAGSPAFVIGVWSSSLFNESTNTLEQLGSGAWFARAAAVVPASPCMFAVVPNDRYVRIAGTVTIDVPAPAGCAWSAALSSDWLTMTSPSAGVGPGTITLVPTLGADPKQSTLTIAGNTVRIHRVIAGTIIDAPVEGSVMTLPFTLGGWSAERTVLQQNGIPAIEVRDGSTPPFTDVTTHIARPDIAALYGNAYLNSGFELRIPRLSAGPHALQVNATSALDGTVMTAVVNVTVQRRPYVVMDLPAAGSQVMQSFRVMGWAADGTAPTGVGIDAVQIWAHPANGAPPIFLGNAQYGLVRNDVRTFMGGEAPWDRTGFDLTAFGLAPGNYTIRALARSTVTGQFDAMAESAVTVQSGSQPPIGAFDTPAEGASVAGSIAVTGWALDDTGVDRVEIWRDLQPGETTPPHTGSGPGNGKVFVARAPFVSGARSDIEAAYPTWPNANRAGWGYLMLTYGLWGQGNGSYVLHAVAFDQEGNATVLGSKSITVGNATSTKPFGALDTPAVGETVSGAFWSFGWALTPNATPACTIPPNGVQVSIDSGPLQPVTYGDMRSDIAAAFPGYTNSNGASGAFYLDTTTLTNGPHTIGWYVVDNCGRAEGIGSRFFTVQNGSATTAARANLGSRAYMPAVSERRTLRIVPGERLEVPLPTSGGAYLGHQIVNGTRRPLPLGASLDAAGGIFYWQPLAGFNGAYDLEFVSSFGDAVAVRVIVGSSVQAVIDTPRSSVSTSFTIEGWAIDEGAASGTGIDAVHVWAYPAAGGDPFFLGSADVGGYRPDIAALFGDQFGGAAYGLAVTGLAPGEYTIVVYSHSTVAGEFRGARIVRVLVREPRRSP